MADPVSVRRPPRLSGPEFLQIQDLWRWTDYVVRFSKKLTQPVSVTAAYTVAAEVYEVRCNGTFTVTLPPVGTVGRPLLVKNIGSGTITVDGSGAETIDGALTKTLSAQYSAIALIDNGSSWDVAFFYSATIATIAGLTPTDGNFIVGDGTTWVVESGATARTSLGLGTGDSPQFTAVNIGHASDTTITRASAGDIAVEGNAIYRAGGTDVPVTDGGTGASTAAGARTNLDVPSNAEAILDAIIDAKGDLIVGTAADTPARLAVGTDGQVLTADSAQASGVKWAAAAGGGLTLVGSDTTERTTTSTGADAATLSSVTGLSIPQGTPFRIMFRCRKTAGAAAAPRIGLKINATQVISSAATAPAALFSANNRAEDGIAAYDIYPGDTNYQCQILGGYRTSRSDNNQGGGSTAFPGSTFTTTVPSATVTDIVLTGDAVNAAVTLATDELRVWTYPIS